MAATLDGLRGFLTLPKDKREDQVLDLCLAAAISKAKAAGIPDYPDNAQYDLFLYALAAMYYDKRGMGQMALEADAQRMINSFVLELRYAGNGYGKQ